MRFLATVACIVLPACDAKAPASAVPSPESRVRDSVQDKSGWYTYHGNFALDGVAGSTVPDAPERLWKYKAGNRVEVTPVGADGRYLEQMAHGRIQVPGGEFGGAGGDDVDGGDGSGDGSGGLFNTGGSADSSVGGGTGNNGGGGTGGGLVLDGGLSDGKINPDAACDLQKYQTTLTKAPVDIIIIVDNSCSMYEEQENVFQPFFVRSGFVADGVTCVLLGTSDDRGAADAVIAGGGHEQRDGGEPAGQEAHGTHGPDAGWPPARHSPGRRRRPWPRRDGARGVSASASITDHALVAHSAAGRRAGGADPGRDGMALGA